MAKWRVEKDVRGWLVTPPEGKARHFQSWRAAMLWVQLVTKFEQKINERIKGVAEAAQRGQNPLVAGAIRASGAEIWRQGLQSGLFSADADRYFR